MDSTLTIQLFLLGCAVTVALEAYKAVRPARWVLWGAVAFFILLGIAFPYLNTVVPVVTATVSEIVGSPASWFSLGVALFFVLRPYWLKKPTSGVNIASIYDDTKVKSELGNLKVLAHATNDNYKDLSDVVRRLKEAFDIHSAVVTTENHVASENFQALERRVDGLGELSDKAEAIRVFGVLTGKEIEKTQTILDDLKIKNLSAFHAIGERDCLSKFQVVIEQDFNSLYERLKGGEVYDREKWNQWENVYSHWLEMLDRWLEKGKFYTWSATSRIFNIDEKLYGESWSVSDDQFPNAEAVRRFKKLCMINRNWHSVLRDVNKGVEQVAFNGLSEEDVRHGRPAE